MATKYVSTLTGAQMDKALTDMNNHISEAWAVGERNGTPVTSGDETYNNNAKYYASQAGTAISAAQAAATQAGASASAAATSATNSANSATAAAGSASAASASATTAANQAVRAKDEANRAEAIVGGQFVTYGAPQSLTEEQKQQARENIGAGSGSGGGRNLLDNWWFGKGVVNQRGQTVYQGGRYCIDRWIIDNNRASVTVTLTDDGIIYARTGTEVHASFTQKFDTALPKVTPGQTVTLSAIIDGELKSVTFAYPSNEIKVATWGLIDVYVSPLQVNFYVPASRGTFSYLIKCAELTPGEESALENALPPDYATELLKCQRYYYRINGVANSMFAVGHMYSAATFLGHVQFPIAMRTPPTQFTYSSASGFKVVTDRSYTSSALYMTNPNAQGTFLQVEVSGAIEGKGADVRFATASDWIAFSADL